MPSAGGIIIGYGVTYESVQSVGGTVLSFAGKAVYLSCGATDMRKSINGLSAIVENSFRLDPYGEAV